MKNIKKILFVVGCLFYGAIQLRAQGALNFDGVDDYTEIAASAVPNVSSTLTLEAWVNPGTGYGVFSQPNDPVEVISRWGGGGAGNAAYRLGINSSGKAVFDVFNGSASSGVTSTATVPTGAWTHIAGVRTSSNTLTIYVNGVASGTVSGSVTPQNSNYTVRLGRPIVGTNAYKGSIDEARIWNVARSQSEIQGAKDCELLGSETGLLTYFKFNQSSGTTLSNTAATTNGTLVNFALTGGTSNWVASGGVPTGTFCALGAALAFDGVNDYVSLGNPASLQLTSGTVEFRVKTAGGDANEVLCNKAGFYEIFLLNGQLRVYNSQTGADVVSTSISLTNNVWRHVAMSFGPGTNNSKIYVDGTLAATFTLSNALNTGNMFIGSSNPAQAPSASFDEFRIWNTVRTQAEITEKISCELLGNEPELVAYYKFNQSNGTTLNDATTNANNGTLNNFAFVGAASNWIPSGGVTTGTLCASGAALAFDGTNDYVNIGNSASLQLTSGTIEFWVQTNSTAGNDVLCSRGGFFEILLLSSMLNVYDSQTGSLVASPGINLSNNAWRHIAMSFAPGANNSKLYVDGALVSTFTLSNAVNTNGITISSSNAAQACVGTFDEFRVWNTVRTQAEILEKISCELAGNETGLAAYYRFNQSSGTVLYDATTNANNGTLSNFALTGNTSNWLSNGAVVPGSVCATGNAALSFDGVNDYVEIPHTTSLNSYTTSGEITIEYWIKPGALTGTMDILAKRPAGNNAGFVVESSSGLVSHFFYTNVGWESGDITYTSNVWQHVAVTAKAGDAIRIYKDGVLVTTKSLAGVSFTPSTTALRLMANTMALDRFTVGTLDEVRIWNIVRTESQILGTKDCELAGTESGLVAYYKLNQTGGTDASPNGNNGTLNNFIGPAWVAPGGVVNGTTCGSLITISGLLDACGSTTLAGQGGNSYAWSTGATTDAITVTTSGTYTVVATLANGTTTTAEAIVNILPLPATPTFSGSTTACDVVSFTAAGGLSYVWSNGENAATATFNSSGTYTVTITDANGCTTTASQVVTVNKATATISGAADGCDVVTLTATGGNLYVWTGGATGATATFDEAGNYSVTATDANGCTAIANHTIFNVARSKTYYMDADGDGYGNAENPIQACTPLPGYLLLGLDCDDSNPLINPGATETCDDIDNNCNGILIEENCPGSNAPVAEECASRSTTLVLTGKVFFNYGSFTNARNTVNKSSSTIGQPSVGMVIGDDLNVGFGFWTRFLLSPSAPTVVATQGDLPDRVQINWSADPLSPSAATYKIYRDGALLATVDNETFAFIDFNVLAGQFYTYEIAGVNQFGEGTRGGSLGFLNPNGVVTGQVKSFSGNPVIGTTVKLSPTLGAAVEFNGLSTIFAEYSPTFPREKFTLSCWAKIGDGNPSSENTGIFDLGSDRGKNWWLHAVTPANGSKGAKFGIGKNLTTRTEVAYTLPDSTKNAWHHYAATYNGSSLLFYVDGELVSTAVGEIEADSTVLFIGKRSDEGGYFKGKIDELRFYNRQLAQTEIQMTMNQTVSPNADGLTSYWKYDEGTGSKGFDLTLNKVKTFLCGATWTTDKPKVVNAGISDETGFYQIEGVNYGAGTTFTARPFKDFHYNQSLEFNAANQSYATLTNFDLPDSSTVEITVKNFDFSASQVILSKEGHFELGLNAGNLTLKMGGATQILGPIGMGFHRLSFVLKQTGGNVEATFYKNGVLVSTYNFSGVAANFSGGTAWTLGKNAAGNYFTGLIDEVVFFSTLLSVAEIQTFANIGTNVTHSKLSVYFNLNEGSGTVLHDMGTALTGAGSINKASWSTVAAISQTLPHEFTPSSRLVTLNPSNTSADQIDFTDQSTIPVSGYVRFEKTECFQKGVEILINGKSNVPQVFTDANGKFTVDLEPGETVRLSPKFGEHTYYPAFWDVQNVSSPVSGILFRNQTKRKVVGQVAGGLCRKSVIPDQAIVKVKVATLNG